jgi:hypothetical protein
MYHSVTPHFTLTVYLCGPFSSHTKQQSLSQTLILVMAMQYVFLEVGTTLRHIIYMIQKSLYKVAFSCWQKCYIKS